MNKVVDAITKDKYTTSIAMLCLTALVIIGVRTNQLNLANTINFIFTALIGMAAKDGGTPSTPTGGAQE